MKLTIAQYIFPDDEIHQLREYRDTQHDDRVKLRCVALFMLVEEVAIEIAASVLGKSVSTIERWGDNYLTKGIDSLNSFQYTPKHTYVKPVQIEQLVTWVNTTNPAKTKQVKASIQEQFGVTYSVEAVRLLMHKHGLKRIRPKTQPGKPPTVEEQQECVANYEQMTTECEPGTVFRFVDAMHLVHQHTPGYVVVHTLPFAKRGECERLHGDNLQCAPGRGRWNGWVPDCSGCTIFFLTCLSQSCTVNS